ncbi:TNFAIP3-interacting protein 1 isoform X2 [Limanda limanda]|uniref:TNFAIP3-interacting protein 1 isoform X2 n=1 Tax=Limanda limanda TaxID=27771 RepID=UPI0029C75080|nr:TNFAIP3-interacting protein 1 isoform X2 [Limanda limanda]
MEGKGPYRIYDPGGSEVKAREEAGGGSSYRQLLEENNILRERMKGLKSLGDLLEESQSEASKLRQRVEELVRDNEALKSSSFAASLCMGGAVQTETPSRFQRPDGKPCLHATAEQKEEQTNCLGKTLQPEKPNAGSVKGVIPPLPQENIELVSQLKRLESSFSIFAEESNPNQLLAHLGRMAVEFHHLSSKVQKNEQRTSLLQTLCEQLRQENNDLRKKMEDDHHIRNQDLEHLRLENQKLKELVTGGAAAAGGAAASSAVTSDTEAPEEPVKEESAAVRSKMEALTPQKSGKATEKTPTKHCDVEVYEKKIKLLEKQRKDVLEVNKQWDIQWNSMKSQFEQKITDLRQRLAESQKTVLELEAEREQRQRDYDKKLLLAKSKIENVQGEKECLNTETTELKQKVRYLQDQLLPLSKQREYQEKEIQRLNRALEEALNLKTPSSSQQPPGQANFADPANNQKKQELLTQIAVLKEQVKIFEEDFRKERSDRERMNEEKEDLRRQVERLQGQITNLTNQLHQAQNECQRERTERCKLERLQMHHKQGQQQKRRTSDPTSGSVNGLLSPPYCGPFVQVGPQGLEGWPTHFPTRMPNAAGAAAAAAPPPVRDFQPVTPGFPWQSSFPQPRGTRAVGESSRPPPENADQSAAAVTAAAAAAASTAAAATAAASASIAAGYREKRERQNIDPGKH